MKNLINIILLSYIIAQYLKELKYKHNLYSFNYNIFFKFLFRNLVALFLQSVCKNVNLLMHRNYLDAIAPHEK